jgi:hypothetical protein
VRSWASSFKATVVPVFKRRNHAALSNYKGNSILNNLSKLYELIFQYLLLRYVKLNRNQHGFTRTKYTVTSRSLVTFLQFLTPNVSGQRQADVLYFDISNAF